MILLVLAVWGFTLAACGDSQQSPATGPASPVHGMWYLAEDATAEARPDGRAGFFYFARGGTFEHYSDGKIYTGNFTLQESEIAFDVAGDDPVPSGTWRLEGDTLDLVFDARGRTKTTHLWRAPAEHATPSPFEPLATRFTDALRKRVGGVVAKKGPPVRFGTMPDLDLRHALAFFRLKMRPVDESRPERVELVFRFVWLRGTWRPVDGRVQVEDRGKRHSYDLFNARHDGGLELNDEHPFSRAAVDAWLNAVGPK